MKGIIFCTILLSRVAVSNAITDDDPKTVQFEKKTTSPKKFQTKSDEFEEFNEKKDESCSTEEEHEDEVKGQPVFDLQADQTGCKVN